MTIECHLTTNEAGLPAFINDKAREQWLVDVARSVPGGSRKRWYSDLQTEAEEALCAVCPGHAVLRIKGKPRLFAVVDVSQAQDLPKIGAMARIMDRGSRIDVQKRGRACLRPVRGNYGFYKEHHNAALVAKACELAHGVNCHVLEAGSNEAAEWGATECLRRMKDRGLRVCATYSAQTGSWRVSTHHRSVYAAPSVVNFKAPSPQEIIDLLNAEADAEKERRALARVGRRVGGRRNPNPSEQYARPRACSL